MDFTHHTLGCGSAKPSGRHNPSCTVLDIRGTLYMIDCGEGTQQMFQRQKLKFNRLRHIFLTHLHGDHWLGLPGLLCTLNLTQCEGKITLHTFREGIELISRMMAMLCPEPKYDLEYAEIKVQEEVIYDNNHLSIRTLPLQHRVPTVGYLIEEKPRLRHIRRDMTDFHAVPYSAMESLREGKDFVKPDGTVIPNRMLTSAPTPSVSYAHISDTAYTPALAQKIGSVDLLLHESTYLEKDKADARMRGHSTAREAACTAYEAGAKRLLLTHFSSRYKDDSLFEAEARDVFKDSVAAKEGMKISL